jgi:hypothetical protein
MADLRNQQLKDRYQTLVTVSDTSADPTSGTLQNGRGTAIAINDLLITDKIIHSGDADTAIRFPSDDTIGFETSGTRRVTVTDTGVGIGTTSPNSKMELNSGALGRVTFNESVADGLILSTGGGMNSDNKYYPAISFRTADPDIDADKRIVFSIGAEATITQTAGILNNSDLLFMSGQGVATPVEVMRIKGNGDVTIADKIIHSGDTDTAIRFPANDTVTVETGGTERMRVDSSGLKFNNIETRNYIIAQDDITILLNEYSLNERCSFRLFAQDSAARSEIIADIVSDGSSNNVAVSMLVNQGLVVNVIKRLRVTYDGTDYLAVQIARNIVGTYIPRVISVIGLINSKFNVIESSQATLVTDLGLSSQALSSYFSDMHIAGNVGIGTTSPATKLDVSGSIRASTGILFGTDTAADNTLGDYEQGTWPIGIAFGGASVDVTYNASTSAKFTKIGRLVTLTGRLRLSNKGTSTGHATITGLPFTVFNNDGNYSGINIGFMQNITFADKFMGLNQLNTTTIELYEVTNAGVFSTITNADFDNNSEILFSIFYYTT